MCHLPFFQFAASQKSLASLTHVLLLPAASLNVNKAQKSNRGPAGARPYLAKPEIPVGTEPGALNPVRFHEYFHGDTGLGLGASHQTGWTALVAPLLKDLAKSRSGPQT